MDTSARWQKQSSSFFSTILRKVALASPGFVENFSSGPKYQRLDKLTHLRLATGAKSLPRMRRLGSLARIFVPSAALSACCRPGPAAAACSVRLPQATDVICVWQWLGLGDEAMPRPDTHPRLRQSLLHELEDRPCYLPERQELHYGSNKFVRRF